ncbi:GumC family protein [Mesobaculum littorinae]|uniref:GumC family protein n=1 Tax=Mesobaculum littorinae TaxID=2486419 RepID=UPI0019D432FF|nr:hypothetical protein [Mesobaculum littorinae]
MSRRSAIRQILSLPFRILGAVLRPLRRLWPFRTPLRDLTVVRVLAGGPINDLGRLPRYLGFFLLGAALIWAPIASYLSTAPLRYTSQVSLILPGAGASASVNLDQIGQASSNSSSPFSNNSVSPTETYKRLLSADRILSAAAAQVGVAREALGKPRVELVDQTGLIHIQMTGGSPEDAQDRAEALVGAFFSEVDALRNEELDVRTESGSDAIAQYRGAVDDTRVAIQALQRESGLISVDQYNNLVGEAEALRSRASDLANALGEETEAVEALRRALGIGPALASATLKLHADSEFSAIIEEMGLQAAKLSEAKSQYGDSHPKVRAVQARYDVARNRAQARARRVTNLGDGDIAQLDLAPIGGRSGLLSQLVTQEARRAGLAAEHDAMIARLAQTQARVRDLIDPAARLEDLQRDFRVAEAVFASALARTETTKTDLYASYPLVQVLENASLPEGPSSPKTKLAIAAGVAGTLFLLMGLMLTWLRRPLIGRLLENPETADAPRRREAAGPEGPAPLAPGGGLPA